MSFRTELRRRLAELCNQGTCAKDQIDSLEGIHQACPAADLAAVFAEATTEQLGQLRDAFAADRVIKRAYVDRFAPGGPKGCLMHHLFGWSSNEDLWNWTVADGLLLSASRTMRRWDYGIIETEFVIAQLASELARRETRVVCQAAPATESAVPTAVALAG